MRRWLRRLVARPWLIALSVGLIAAGLAGLVSAHGGDATLVHGCVSTNSNPRGQVTVYALPGQSGPSNGLAGPTGSCGALGTPLDWGVIGPAGPQGLPGPSGITGLGGPSGPSGVPGPRGPSANTIIGGTIRDPNSVENSSSYSTVFGFDRTDTDVQQLIMPSAGTVQNLQVKLESAPGTGTAYVVNVLRNGANSSPSLQCIASNPGTTCADINPLHAITYDAGDTISIRMQNAAPQPASSTPMHWAVTFIPS
jgi:hypothetical protein